MTYVTIFRRCVNYLWNDSVVAHNGSTKFDSHQLMAECLEVSFKLMSLHFISLCYELFCETKRVIK